MTTIENLNERRAKLRAELADVDREIAARHGQVDDPSDRPEGFPVPGRGKAGPPPDPRPDPEVDPETGKAVGDVERSDREPEAKRTEAPRHATATNANTSTKATK